MCPYIDKYGKTSIIRHYNTCNSAVYTTVELTSFISTYGIIVIGWTE